MYDGKQIIVEKLMDSFYCVFEIANISAPHYIQVGMLLVAKITFILYIFIICRLLKLLLYLIEIYIFVCQHFINLDYENHSNLC